MIKKFFSLLLSGIIFLFLLTTCGSYAPSESTANGSISFKIEWQDAQISSKSAIYNLQSEIPSYAPLYLGYPPFDCSVVGVETIQATVYDSAGNSIASGGPWSCSAHSGDITNVPSGTNLRVLFTGKDSGGNDKYTGVGGGITVLPGKVTTAQIMMISLGASTPTDVIASPDMGQITISWSSYSTYYDLSEATSYNIYWSLSSGVTKTTGTKITVATSPYTHTGLANGTTYYYVLTAVNSYGESIESSQVNATTLSKMLKLPDTGQTGDYTSTFGEDSDYTINPPSYTDNGNGTITDNVTSFMWQKEDDNTTRIWANAGTYCDSLTLGSYSDWRLPSKKEIISIVNYSTYSPAINLTYFPNTNLSFYWSSTTYAGYSSYAWYVSFYSGNVSFMDHSNSSYVRCVRAGQ